MPHGQASVPSRSTRVNEALGFALLTPTYAAARLPDHLHLLMTR
jgi:hypothetical protein